MLKRFMQVMSAKVWNCDIEPAQSYGWYSRHGLPYQSAHDQYLQSLQEHSRRSSRGESYENQRSEQESEQDPAKPRRRVPVAVSNALAHSPHCYCGDSQLLVYTEYVSVYPLSKAEDSLQW